ncbi:MULTISPECIES: alpha/beta fold hydrolase [Streptomyces]|nr:MULTISPECIES: alpha/beta fold hydrolase [Streptomyces]MYT09043.1 alpha/beta fold hydrolase [Streptomyces sp. SID5470]
MTRQTLELGNGAISYRTQGEGPPLVLVSTLAGTWIRQIPELSQHFSVITYDMRGFGDSPSSQGFPSNAEHADDLDRLLEELGIPRASVLGLSHGGLVAQHFALRHPHRVHRLALVATFGRPGSSTGIFLNMLNGFLDRDDLPNFWEVLKSFLFSAAGWERMTRMETHLRRAMFDQYTVAALRSIYGQAREHDLLAALGAIHSPTLVIGGAEDMLFPPSVTEALAAAIPGASLELLPAAHVPPVEAPLPFNKIVTEFFGAER